MRLNPSWQARTGGIDAAQLQIDWDHRQAWCPMGKQSAYWHEYQTKEYAHRVVKIRFRKEDCLNCVSRPKCVKNKKAGRSLQVPSREMYEALEQTRKKLASDAGRKQYKKRGIQGTISQGVRRGTLRRSRYRGLEKTHLQEVATATAINIVRAFNFLNLKPLAKTRVSRFARLANSIGQQYPSVLKTPLLNLQKPLGLTQLNDYLIKIKNESAESNRRRLH